MEPVVANGSLVSMSNGSSTKNSAFTFPGAKVFANGFPVVTEAALLGGLAFTATLVTVIVSVGGLPVVLVGATVTDSAGYSGVLSPAEGAGAKFDFG